MSDLITTELMEKVRRIEIRTRRIVQNRTAGAYHASFKGQGIEFAEVREFQEGDDIRAIDPNVSARFGHPYIKLFTEEREQNVFLFVDRSASGLFGSSEHSKTEITAEVAAVLAFSATLNKDRVGLMLYTDREELHLNPARGHRHVLRIIRELLAFETESPRTDLREGLQRLLEAIPRRSIIFILSDLLAGDYEQPLYAIARKHEAIVLHISDPLERSLPSLPALSLQDLESGEVLRLSSRRANSLEQRSQTRENAAKEVCHRAGIDFVSIDTATDYVPELIGLFRRRMARRQ